MKVPSFHVDAFTGRLFSGNPAAVCLLEAWIPDPLLQKIAFEKGLSETAFIVPRQDGTCELRWFTPAREVDLCGHATLAAAHVLATHRGIPGPWRFHSQSGLLVVRDRDGLLVLDFPARPATPVEAPEALIRGLGRVPGEVLRARDFLAVFADEDEVRHLAPDVSLLASLDCLGVIATAPGRDCDFVSRFFAPAAGIPEDPVTGSAHCTLVPYWSRRLETDRMFFARQISRRGGELWCALRGDRVDIAGRAVTFSEGHIHLAV